MRKILYWCLKDEKILGDSDWPKTNKQAKPTVKLRVPREGHTHTKEYSKNTVRNQVNTKRCVSSKGAGTDLRQSENVS